MDKFVGLWINNRKALIVTLVQGHEHHDTHESHATRHIRFPGEPKGMTLPHDKDSRYQEDLRDYFNEILDAIKDATSILIFGPGKAKDNLKKTMMSFGDLGTKIAAVETADKMTSNQIVAKVKEYFLPAKNDDHAMRHS